MIKLIIVLVLSALVYCVYWFVAAEILPDKVTTELKSLSEDNMTVVTAPIKISGFPLRFRSDLSPVRLSGAGWSANFDHMEANAPAYLPTSVTLTHEGPAQFSIDHGLFSGVYETQTPMARVDSSLTSSLSRQTEVTAKDVTVYAAEGSVWPVTFAQSIYVLRDVGRKDYTLTFDLTDITVEASKLGDMGRLLGPNAQAVRGRFVITRELISDAPFGAAKNDRIIAEKIVFNWGDLQFDGTLDLIRDGGDLSGEINLLTEDPGAIIRAAQREGMIPQGAGILIDMFLSGLPKNDDGVYELDLTVRRGELSLGPIGMGRLPF
ncbi:DUF2125 domain-containing protein [Robiginitomaculum antarcticum]|uniref:DUF2125 domain-containing protein n=1 Tax=Robiginitomaculum antarcticum TaxID=437507 RepID=UPI00035FDA1C|nr:DUF2125 domain-containing protein [Robiginitomaculum antarcticum]